MMHALAFFYALVHSDDEAVMRAGAELRSKAVLQFFFDGAATRPPNESDERFRVGAEVTGQPVLIQKRRMVSKFGPDVRQAGVGFNITGLEPQGQVDRNLPVRGTRLHLSFRI
jgi:hypothetical protein